MAPFMVTLKRRASGGYIARKVIPKDIRGEYATLYGMAWEEKLSIPAGTAPAAAKAQHGEWLAEIEGRISRLKAAKAGERQSLTRRDAQGLAGDWYRWFIAEQEKDLRTPAYWRRLSDTLVWEVLHPHAPNEYLSDPGSDPEWAWKADPEVRVAVRPLVAQEAKVASFLRLRGIALTEDAQNMFVDAVEDNLLAAFIRLEALARGYYGPDTIVEGFPEYIAKTAKTRPSLTCGTLFARWQADVKPARSTVARWAAVFKAADAKFSDVGEVNADTAKPWLMSLITEDRTAHTIATVWRTALKTVFSWAVGEKLIADNPFKALRISVPKKVVERETKAFTDDEAKTILKAALAYQSPTTVDERARRWVPWICAYTGARAGEITQLRPTDIHQRGGNWFAKLSPSAGKIKTRTARTVPLHEHLIEQGFIGFVESMGDAPLFYEPSPPRRSDKPEPVQNPAERTRSRLGDWVRSLGITDRELSPNHAWRHTFKAKAERFGMSERYSDAITGHAPPTAGRAYGKPTPEDLAEAMRRFPRYEVQ